MAEIGSSITDWLQLSQSVSQTGVGRWQVFVGVAQVVIAAAQIGFFWWQLRVMATQNNFIRRQHQSDYGPELRVTNFQAWPSDGSEGDRVKLQGGEKVVIRVHAVNVGGSVAYLCQKEANCAMAFLAKKDSCLPMFKPYKAKGARLASLTHPDPFKHYEGKDLVASLKPGEFGFWQFSYEIPHDFSGNILFVAGLVAYWDGDGSREYPRNRRRLVAFARHFCEERQIFLSVDPNVNPDYEYVE